MNTSQSAIGVFDSGYGGLTVLKSFIEKMPQYDYLYLGDNARAPYGNRSFDTVHQYTWECVQYLFASGCHLVILACNTASAKALRTIQQKDLPLLNEYRRVLGVIRPTTEQVGSYSKTKHVGVLGTAGTVASGSYPMEIAKFYPDVQVFQQACPMWVPLIENAEHLGGGADYFVEKYIDELFCQSDKIDTIVLGCTHYPLLVNKIKSILPSGIQIVSQGEIVADSLECYLQRHAEMEQMCSKNGTQTFLTTDDANTFNRYGTLFFGQEVLAKHITI